MCTGSWEENMKSEKFVAILYWMSPYFVPDYSQILFNTKVVIEIPIVQLSYCLCVDCSLHGFLNQSHPDS